MCNCKARRCANAYTARDRVQTHSITGLEPPYFNNCPNTSCNVVFNCFATLLFGLFLNVYF